MEAVHNPDSNSWIGEKINLQEHFSKYQDLVHSTRAASARRAGDLTLLSSRNVKKLVETVQATTEEGDLTSENVYNKEKDQLDDKLFDKIETLCHVDNLTIANEVAPMQQFLDTGPTNREIPERQIILPKYPKFQRTDVPEVGKQNLRTLSLQSEFLEKANSYDKHKRMRFSRHQNNNWFEAAPPIPTAINNKVTDKEILVIVRVYRPIKKDSYNSRTPWTTPVNLGNMRYVQEFNLLGSNRLSELRDHIKCATDLMVAGDVSSEPAWKDKLAKKQRALALGPVPASRAKFAPRAIRKPMAKEVYKSGFFYIEGCFYNDMRWPDCIDYSETIRKWAKPSRRKIGPFTTAKMEETFIRDLTIRLGYPYVYVHQGQHEHLFSFTDARLLSVDDPQRVSDYPFERSVATQHSSFCMLCAVNISKWVTTHNERVPEEPFFFCEVCFRGYNYGENGEKIGNFRAYPYVDVNAL